MENNALCPLPVLPLFCWEHESRSVLNWESGPYHTQNSCTQKQAVSISGHSTQRSELVISTRLQSCLSREQAMQHWEYYRRHS